jgi:hypothetical protein
MFLMLRILWHIRKSTGKNVSFGFFFFSLIFLNYNKRIELMKFILSVLVILLHMSQL